MDKKASLLGVLRTLFRWKKQIVIICGVAVIGTVVISLLLPNFYKAKTVFFAASSDQAKPELLFNRAGDLRLEYYGNENDVDRLLTVAESNELADILIDSFGLMEHYDINPELSKARHRVREKFFKHYEVLKNKRDAIELTFESTDRELAARVANTTRALINSVALDLIRSGQSKTLNTYRQNIKNRQQRLQILTDSLAQLRSRYGIYNLSAQTEALTTQLDASEARYVRSRSKLQALKETRGIPRDTIRYLEANVQGMKVQLDSMEIRMDRLRDGMGIVQQVEKEYLEVNQRLSEDRERAKALAAVFEADVPALLLVEEAEVPIVKSRPRRSILVVVAGMIAFFFSVLGVLLFDTYRNVNWQEIVNG